MPDQKKSERGIRAVVDQGAWDPIEILEHGGQYFPLGAIQVKDYCGELVS